jgi:sulfur-oxidizing protein SoxB
VKLTRRAMMAAAGAAALLPARSFAASDPFDMPRQGDARIIHITDTHAQTLPVHYREPSQNIGVGVADGRPPHLVGEAFLKYFDMPVGGRRAHAFTFLDYEKLARQYGPLGGFAQLKTAIDRLRAEAGPGRSLLVDGGDLCQGSGLANLTGGLDMVALANILGTEAMTGHWEFTYGQDGLAKIIKAFKGKFIAQNVFLSAEAGMEGKPAFNQTTGAVFPPYVISEIGGYRIGVIGQAFPYVPIAHPPRFTPDWRFGIRPDNMQKMVDELRQKQKIDVVLLLSHNGMDVDLKLASQVTGIDIIMGGHTHDAVPVPQIVANSGGKTFVTNAGTAGNFIGVLDLTLAKGRLTGLHYTLMPVYTHEIKADPAIIAEIETWRTPHKAMLDEKLADIDTLLYRRNNFYGSVDQVICDALRQEMDAQIAFSPGFRWGNTYLSGQSLTMGDLLSETAITYPSVYTQSMMGAEMKSVMEDVCDNLFNRNPYYQQGGDMMRVGGMNYACTPREAIGHRISAMTLDNGDPVEASKSYKVVSWASVSLPQTGKPVWEVVAANLRARKTITITKPNTVKLLGIQGNPGFET